MAALAKSWRREQVPTPRRKGDAHTAGEVGRGIEHSLEHFPSALNRRDSQPLSPRRIWGN